MVTATIPYGGITVDNVTFSVTGAYVKEIPGEPAFLVFTCDVNLPDGTPMKGVGWDSVKVDADPTEPSPLVQADAAMQARLTASGATNITEV